MKNVYMSITGAALMLDGEWVSVGESGRYESMQKTLSYYAENAVECDFKVIIANEGEN